MLDNGRPETVYELCEQVCEAIAERPLNYVQQKWSTEASAWNEGACGTAYCRAGWIAAILKKSKGPVLAGDVFIHKTAKKVLETAGVPEEEVLNLFSGSACGLWRTGTPEYTAAGIKGMRDFMTKHEAKLKAARINGDNSVTVMEKADG